MTLAFGKSFQLLNTVVWVDLGSRKQRCMNRKGTTRSVVPQSGGAWRLLACRLSVWSCPARRGASTQHAKAAKAPDLRPLLLMFNPSYTTTLRRGAKPKRQSLSSVSFISLIQLELKSPAHLAFNMSLMTSFRCVNYPFSYFILVQCSCLLMSDNKAGRLPVCPLPGYTVTW